jgi:Family of unknown function (DUF6526)
MSKQVEQTRENHVQRDPPFHFFIIPLGIFLFVWATMNAVRRPSSESEILAGLAFLFIVLALKARVYALKVQDRVIRLEERLRLAALLNTADCGRIGELTEGQLVALRFASDAEVPVLTARALNENLDRKSIKAAIQQWRGDYFRV